MKWTSWVRSWRSRRGVDEWGAEWGAKMGYGRAGGDGDAAEAQYAGECWTASAVRGGDRDEPTVDRSRLPETKTGPKMERLTTIHERIVAQQSNNVLEAEKK
ncbi:hypothetical protein K438DRAFT_1789196 [Mycena galopus ATCC 62051]|nr:hypothetical protein K438DRAFT_1789196 [Mycena galopus ATCC 62051]